MRSSFWRCCGVVAEAPRPFSKTAPLRRFRDRYLARCGVRRECLDYALANMDTTGIWGGTTAQQLRHWFGTGIYAVSHDIRLTQELLGHQSPNTTAIYVAWAAVDAAPAVASLRIGHSVGT
jgi:integrase